MNPLAKIRSQSKSKPLQDSDFPKIHELFMREYGWISIEEMKTLPLPTLWNLYGIIQERKEKEEQYQTDLKNKKGRR